MCDQARRKSLLTKLQCMVDKMPEYCPKCPRSPVIEIYDPCPKPAIPLGGPAPCTPLDPTVPVPHVASPSNPCGGCTIPVISPQPVPCVPLARACPVPEQPCVPCNPPQMMVAFRRAGPKGLVMGGGGCCGKTYDCLRRNGLQDDSYRGCGSSGGGGGCMTMSFGCGGCGDVEMVAEYQCYPAYFKMPPCDTCGQCVPPCGPGIYGPCGPCAPTCAPCSTPAPCVPMAPGIKMSVCPPECPDCPGPCMPSCTPPVPTIALPPCPPITVPAPPPVIPTPVPIPVPTPCYPSCPPQCCAPPCVSPCGQLCP